MSAPRKHPPELRERAIRLVAEAREQESGLSLNAAAKRVGPRAGVSPDTLRGWVKQADIDAGRRPGIPAPDAARARALERENRELKRANEILLALGGLKSLRAGARPASSLGEDGSESAAESLADFGDVPCLDAPAGQEGVQATGPLVATALGASLSTSVMVDFIDSVRERFGVEPVCQVLSQFVCRIPPGTYYAAKKRPPSARQLRDEKIKEVLLEIWHDPGRGRELLGARKVWQLMQKLHLEVDGRPVARCTVERLMRDLGLVGVRRGDASSLATVSCQATVAGTDAEQASDRVHRDFTVSAPNRLWVVEVTYLDTEAGEAFAAFVQDVFSRRIVGWALADHDLTELPLAALEMALDARARAGQATSPLVHDVDAGVEYTAIRYRDVLCGFGALASIGTVGDSYYHAMAESLNGVYKTECYNRRESWENAWEIELATSSWVEWYNTARPHSSLGGRTPAEHESACYKGELPEGGDQPEDQALRLRGPDGRYLPRDNDRDLSPRSRRRPARRPGRRAVLRQAAGSTPR